MQVSTTLLNEVLADHERDLSMQGKDPLKFPVNPDTDLLRALYRDAQFLLRARTARIQGNWEELEMILLEFYDVSTTSVTKMNVAKSSRTSLLPSGDSGGYETYHMRCYCSDTLMLIMATSN